ncbi:hypothetical protein MTR67_043313 [Solanum verrucosum]|uniref:Uncharacterized protein n=1 Tax=Solanum verrucosum TaxID=315347 RepID=A0AAF0UNH9_SOLVR|nr:hypothetical protein MTR67_043313 [Solanum verrucosum]
MKDSSESGGFWDPSMIPYVDRSTSCRVPRSSLGTNSSSDEDVLPNEGMRRSHGPRVLPVNQGVSPKRGVISIKPPGEAVSQDERSLESQQWFLSVGHIQGIGSDREIKDFKGRWEDHLSLIEFAYNNSYHSSIQMAPYEALYGRRFRSPVGWFEVGEAALIGPDSVLDAMEKVQLIRDRLKTAQSR